MSNPTQGSEEYADPQSGYPAGSAGGTDPYATGDPYASNVPYEPIDPNAPAVGGYAATGTSDTGSYADTGGYVDIGSGSDSSSTKDVAKDEAANVKDTAVGAGKEVAATAKEEAANVAGEAKQQAQSLLSSATSELKSQASSQQGKLAGSLRGYADQLQGLGQGQPLEAGPLNDLVQQAASKGSEIVSFIENREPADLLDELRRYARRRPVMFLALSGLAGVVAGRIARGAVAANTSVDSPSPSRSLTDTSYTTTGVDYVTPANTYGDVTPGSTYGAYTDASTETTSVGYADRGDPIR